MRVTTVKVFTRCLPFLVDTGATVNVLTDKDLDKICSGATENSAVEENKYSTKYLLTDRTNPSSSKENLMR